MRIAAKIYLCLYGLIAVFAVYEMTKVLVTKAMPALPPIVQPPVWQPGPTSHNFQLKMDFIFCRRPDGKAIVTIDRKECTEIPI